MKLRHIIFTAYALTLSSLAHTQDNCRPIETTDPKGSIWITAEEIVRPGQYCLTHDIKAPRVSDFSSGGARSYLGDMLPITASDVVFDLHGYMMNADASGVSGIHANHEWNKSFQRHITIRNGTIKSRTQSGIVLADMFGKMISLRSDVPDDKKFNYPAGLSESIFKSGVKDKPTDTNQYPETVHIVERIKVEAGGVHNMRGGVIAIGMKGASNIIRNSTIEVTDGHAAIYLFGPNQLIENNIIIFKGKAAVESAAAIKLHQADGTIIRNNDIIIESSGDEAPKAAISLIDSKDVVIEGNRIYGIKTLTHNWDDKSNSVEKNNEFRSMLRRPWATGAPGVH